MKKKFSLGENGRRLIFGFSIILLTVSWYRATPARTDTATEGTYSDVMPTEGELKSYRFWYGTGAVVLSLILLGTEVAISRGRRKTQA